MASTYSILKFELPANGEQSGTWGTTTNTNIGTAIEQAIVGMATLDSGDFTANVATLTLANTNAAQDARALCLNIAAGAVSAAGTVNVPAIQKPYIVINGSSFTVTVKVSGQTGVAVPAGKRTVVYNNGTDVGSQIDWLGALDITTINATTVDATNVEATNLKAKDGTAGMQIADSTGAVSFTANPVLSGGTANGVAYLNGSKVLTTGSALTFDGSNFGVGTSSPSTFGKFAVSGADDAALLGLASATGVLRARAYNTATTGAMIESTNAAQSAYANLFVNGLNLLFGTGNTERARIDSSGNVGIGTSSPQAKLAVSNSGAAGFEFFTNYPGGGVGTYIQSFNRSAAAYSNTAYDAAQHAFFTSGTERARIDSSGNLLVGTTSNAIGGFAESRIKIQAAANKNAIGIDGISQDFIGLLTRPSGAHNYFAGYFLNSSNTNVGNIQVSTTATAYVTSSDYRLKNTIAPMTGALAKVAALKPVTYKWNADDSDGQGFIAHELAEVVPDAVTGEKDAVDAEGNPVYQGIDTSFLVATLTAAIQEQQAIITALTARVAALESN